MSVYISSTGAELVAPESFVNASPEERARICNGCGTEGWKGLLVPEKIYGLRVTDACQVHDWEFHYGKTQADKEAADTRFLINLLRIINHKGGLIAPLRRYRAMTYYNGVAEAGDSAFWKGKRIDGCSLGDTMEGIHIKGQDNGRECRGQVDQT